MPINENTLEQVIISELQEKGYEYLYGPDIERDYHEVLLKDYFEAALLKINPGITMPILEEAYKAIKNLGLLKLEELNAAFHKYLIEGVPVSYRDVTENKTYTVVGTSAGGCTDDASITVYVSPDAIGENADNNISIYPNPTDDVVNVVCKNMKDITIMSMTGQVVGYKDVNDDNAVVDMKDYPQSVYILMIRKDDGSQFRKRIIYSK